MNINSLHNFSRLLVLATLAIAAGCVSIPERRPVPKALVLKAEIQGIPEARTWASDWPAFSSRRFANYTDAEFRREFSAVYGKPHHYLAISGGGANGAFGAGLFSGWTEEGTRPEFAMVTGVSTGALSAPFVFLGPEYDDLLKTVYTTTSTNDIVKKRNILTGIFSDSLADTRPLQALIAKHMNADVIDAIAREHRKGRRLLIGTVNLDAGRSVIWNIGGIAASGHRDRISLIHEIIRASTAIPIAFPPVAIPVVADGETYDELHVDGGTGSQVFVYPAAINWRIITERLKVQGQPKVYVVRNSFLVPDYEGVNRRVVPIGSRTIDSLIRTQGIGDLYQIYALCNRDGNDFNLAYIPSDFTEEPAESFDPVYMSKLFDVGYRIGLAGYPWKKHPPGFVAGDLNDSR